MKKKKRRIRWDRVALLIGILFLLIFGCVSLVHKIIDSKKVETKTVLVTNELYFPKMITMPKKPEIDIQDFIDFLNKKLPICLGTFKLTGYCNCEECCGVWAGGPTYSGVMPQSQHTIAVDPTVIPIGTHVIINGVEYVAEDTGSAIKGNRIDIYCDTHEECFGDFCNGYADVYLAD